MSRFQDSKFSDFEIVETIAETHGSSTRIYLCRFQSQLFICKAVSKDSLRNNAKAVEHIHNQKKALQHFTSLKDRRVCSILGHFQDSENLYLILEMIEGLPFHKLIQMMEKFKLEFTKFTTAQIAHIMEDFHQQGYIYRDLKASNFMINQKGIVNMIDLGKAKEIKKERAFTICGTTHAMPPDIYKKQGYSYEFDYYSFGVLIFELLTGRSPFGYENTKENIKEDIQRGLTPQILSKIEDDAARDLIENLMKLAPEQRLGNKGGFSQILSHYFFNQFREMAIRVSEGKEQLTEYDDNFYEQISEIIDFGLDHEKYQQISEDDPFYKFLQ